MHNLVLLFLKENNEIYLKAMKGERKLHRFFCIWIFFKSLFHSLWNKLFLNTIKVVLHLKGGKSNEGYGGTSVRYSNIIRQENPNLTMFLSFGELNR